MCFGMPVFVGRAVFENKAYGAAWMAVRGSIDAFLHLLQAYLEIM